MRTKTVEKTKNPLEEKNELLQLVRSMDTYQVTLVLAFVTTLFGLKDYDDAEEVRKAA